MNKNKTVYGTEVKQNKPAPPPPLSWFVSRAAYAGEVPPCLTPARRDSGGYLYLPLDKLPDYIRTYHLGETKRGLPVLLVFCAGETNGGCLWEHFVPSSLVTDPSTGIIRVNGTLGGDPGYHQLTYDPNCQKHDDRSHIACVATI
jgi:hypothetical protein